MDDTGLPASIEAAWGRRERPRMGPKRDLSLERIVRAAVQVAESEGLAAVSMHRVATEIGASTMSLYRYVAAKDELLELMVDAAYGNPPSASGADDGWRAGLSRWAQAERNVLLHHPWVLRHAISGPPIAPNQVTWLEAGLTCLHRSGLAEGEKLSVMLLLTGYVRSSTTLAADVDAAYRASGSTPRDAMIAYGRVLGRLTDASQYPALHAVIAAGVFDAPEEPGDPDADFIFGLERLLDGIDALVRARASRTSSEWPT